MSLLVSVFEEILNKLELAEISGQQLLIRFQQD